MREPVCVCVEFFLAIVLPSGRGPLTARAASQIDLVGSEGSGKFGTRVTALATGHCAAQSPYWDDSTATDAGAATWCGGTGGCAGTPSIDNSLIGGRPADNTVALLGQSGVYLPIGVEGGSRAQMDPARSPLWLSRR